MRTIVALVLAFTFTGSVAHAQGVDLSYHPEPQRNLLADPVQAHTLRNAGIGLTVAGVALSIAGTALTAFTMSSSDYSLNESLFYAGPSLLVTSAVFALGHLATIHVPTRLAVFFPSLVFGWLRYRTRGIGAGLTFHAMCNVFSEILGKGYHLYGY